MTGVTLGKKAFVTPLDSPIGGALAKCLSESGYAIYGTHLTHGHAEFVTESFYADYVAHNQEATDAMLSADLVVLVLPGNENVAKATIKQLQDAPGKHLVVGVTSVLSWAKTTKSATLEDGSIAPITEKDEPRRKSSVSARETANVERMLLRAGKPGELDTYVVCPGVLYGYGETPDGFLPVMRAAWEGNPVPLYGSGLNRIPTCHLLNLAATVLRVAYSPPSSTRYILAADEEVVTLKDVTEAIASHFKAEVSERPAIEVLNTPGSEALLLNLAFAATPEVASEVDKFHTGGPVGGIAQVAEEFLAERNLKPLRVVMRGVELSGVKDLAKRVAAAYSVPLISPQTLISEYLPKMPEDFLEEVGELEEGADASALSDEQLLAVLKSALAVPATVRGGYVLQGLPKSEEMCADVFTMPEPKPPKPQPAEGEEGAEDEEESKSEEEEDGERPMVANPDTAPTVALAIEIDDEFADTFKESHPEAHAAYKEYSEAYENAEDDAEIDFVLNYLATSDIVKLARTEIDGTGSHHSRLRAARKKLGEPHNFAGFVEEEPEPVDDEAARSEAEAAAAADAKEKARETAKVKTAAMLKAQQAELAEREDDALHVRSASLRAYLSRDVMPSVTQGMLELLKIRPKDPINALADYLIMLDEEQFKEDELVMTRIKAKEIHNRNRGHVRRLFEKLDKDGSGALDIAEFKEVIAAYNGEERCDVEQFLQWYDTNGRSDTTLDVDEFGWYIADIAWSFMPSIEGAASQVPSICQHFSDILKLLKTKLTEDKAREIVSRNKEDVDALFASMDANGNGKLEVDEWKKVVSEYNGEGVDVDQFLRWYDSNGKADGVLDPDEFGWYLADIAWDFKPEIEGAAEMMPGIIDTFKAIVEAQQKK